MKKYEKAIFAAGCFWGVEYVFSKFSGIFNIKSGYSGGKTKNPTYEEVCSGSTSHAESIFLEYDPKVISYNKLLEIFFKCHDPTTVNRQGPDIGSQYRSIIFYFNDKQRILANKAKEKFKKILNKKIITEILPATEFYRAESYHQKYYEKKGSFPYCHVVPKISLGP